MLLPSFFSPLLNSFSLPSEKLFPPTISYFLFASALLWVRLLWVRLLGDHSQHPLTFLCQFPSSSFPLLLKCNFVDCHLSLHDFPEPCCSLLHRLLHYPTTKFANTIFHAPKYHELLHILGLIVDYL